MKKSLNKAFESLKSNKKQLSERDHRLLSQHCDVPDYAPVQKRIKKDPKEVLECMSKVIKATLDLDLVKRRLIYGTEHGSEKMNSKIKEYQDLSEKIDQMVEDLSNSPKKISSKKMAKLLHYFVGAATESGELLLALLEGAVEGEVDAVNYNEEVGDVKWYLTLANKELKTNFGVQRKANSKKLVLGRYKDGFSEKAAVERDTNAERNLIEKG